jgi:hypothetical protein
VVFKIRAYPKVGESTNEILPGLDSLDDGRGIYENAFSKFGQALKVSAVR